LRKISLVSFDHSNIVYSCDLRLRNMMGQLRSCFTRKS